MTYPWLKCQDRCGKLDGNATLNPAILSREDPQPGNESCSTLQMAGRGYLETGTVPTAGTSPEHLNHTSFFKPTCLVGEYCASA